MDTSKIDHIVNAGGIFYVSHSGGKDSQAMYLYLSARVPQDQIVVVHASLGAIEWDGVVSHIKATITQKLNVVSAGKSLFDMVRRRAQTRPDVPSWPSSAHRQCTSDLKRNPIYKFIRQDMRARGATLGVNCTGIRAAESSARAKKVPWRLNKTLSKAGRTVYEYMPIFDLSTDDVFGLIRQAGQTPFWAYQAGNTRLSCVFCIMGSDNDLKNGAAHNPDLYHQYLALEQQTGWTMFNGVSLKDRVEGGA